MTARIRNTRKRGSYRRARWEWRLLSLAGTGAVAAAGTSFSGTLVGVPILFAFQVLLDALLSIPQRTGKLHFGQIVSVQARDIRLMRTGDRFLRLYNFQIIADSGSKSILRLGQGLFRKIYGAARDLDLIRRRIQVE